MGLEQKTKKRSDISTFIRPVVRPLCTNDFHLQGLYGHHGVNGRALHIHAGGERGEAGPSAGAGTHIDGVMDPEDTHKLGNIGQLHQQKQPQRFLITPPPLLELQFSKDDRPIDSAGDLEPCPGLRRFVSDPFLDHWPCWGHAIPSYLIQRVG